MTLEEKAQLLYASWANDWRAVMKDEPPSWEAAEEEVRERFRARAARMDDQQVEMTITIEAWERGSGVTFQWA